MKRSKICLCLTGETIAEDLEIIEKYRQHIDMVELRVDYLNKDERLHVRNFPSLVHIPTILTIRRSIDGGKYIEGEASRTTLFARALAFADPDPSKNFAYVDFEDDFHVPCLQDAAFAYGTRVIRSFHDMKGTVKNIAEKMTKMRVTGHEIPKIALMPKCLSDVTDVFRQAKDIPDFPHILIAMGPFGVATRILAENLKSFITYTAPIENGTNLFDIGQLDPITLNTIYNFHNITENTKIFGITGYPLNTTLSPILHNTGFKKKNIDGIYIPIRAEKIEEALDFANVIGVQGMSVTVPHKETILQHLYQISAKVGEIGACNTIIKREKGWEGFNTDAEGFRRSLCSFLETDTLKGMKVAIIGAGGAARAAAAVVKELKGKACIFNRTPSRAKDLAAAYNFKWAPLNEESMILLEQYSDLIIQTTSVGLGVSEAAFHLPENDALPYYDFRGHEAVYDMIYSPSVTPVLARAESAGCRICNGLTMLQFQGYKQFELFTGETYE